MSLRDNIKLELPIALLGGSVADDTAGRIMQRVLDAYGVDPDAARDAREDRPGADQGITRLALLAFVGGRESTLWNGPRGNGSGWPGTAWVRYRGHQIDREVTPDGVIIRTTVRDHEGDERVATFAGVNAEHGMSTNLLAVDDIDQLLDIVIEQHGVPDEGVLVAVPVSPADARRALNTFAEWTRARPWPIDNPVDTFIADVKDGTVVL